MKESAIKYTRSVGKVTGLIWSLNINLTMAKWFFN